MPRVTRGLADGMIYHIINSGNCRQEVFLKDEDFISFVGLLAEAKERHPVKLFSYCLMPNHFHLLLAPEKADQLSRFMQWLMTSHVRRHHSHYHTTGHVWQGRYKSFIVEKDRHLLTVARYIEGNPVRAGLAESADQWRWSSDWKRQNARYGKLVDAFPMDLPVAWTQYVNTPMTASEMERMRQSMNRGAPFGSLPWRTAICEKLGLESTIRAKGRPRKWGQEK